MNNDSFGALVAAVVVGIILAIFLVHSAKAQEIEHPMPQLHVVPHAVGCTRDPVEITKLYNRLEYLNYQATTVLRGVNVAGNGSVSVYEDGQGNWLVISVAPNPEFMSIDVCVLSEYKVSGERI